MTKQRLYWVFQIVGWSTYTVLNVLGVSFQSSNFTLVKALPIIIESAFFFSLTHAYRSLSKRNEWLQLPTTQLLPKVILSISLMAITVYLVRILASYALDLYTSDMLSSINFIGNVLANIIILILWSSVYFTFHYFEKNTQSLRYEVAMNEMMLNQLKAQLNPHFIFNALNSIRALVDEEPSKSKKAINHLSNILRTSLVLDKKKVTSFKEELDTTRDYLALESIRFEERLKTEFRIDPQSEAVHVPPMMIQTLVENGIKHGISKLKEGGELSIDTVIKEGFLTIEIRNTGKYIEKKSNRVGQGLRNSRQRLAIIYGENADLQIVNENEHTVLTTVTIPLTNK